MSFVAEQIIASKGGGKGPYSGGTGKGPGYDRRGYCSYQRSKDVEARLGLMDNFGFTELQAQAILDMRLQRLTNLNEQLKKS